ncbi:SDR family oxidoreductase [Novosphingobium sp. 9U]|uniref:SDR family NAD(P)-dependent oxidoreductase n=1 Tax=Novosphingobium sp. 9U TaxID=2653158 RepID=UPI0012F0DCCA|nr:SDR family oxidoreductase [Novosphingobium sp. 9U]VWX51166.1 Short-chain dehydrogenase [Novosphingobium sp. 9U]
MFSNNKGTALVTGASSGIGAIYADRLARRGYNLVLIARNRQRLDALAAHITDQTGRAVEVVAADLGEKAELGRVETVLRTDASVTLLVNNAGIGASVPTWQADVDLMERMIDINVTALTRLAYAAVPGFLGRGAGTIVNIASVVALAPEFLLNGVYAASKAYVIALTASLNAELGDKGVRVQAVLPGATKTDFWDRSGVPLSVVPAEITMRADDMVDAALAGLDLGETVTVPALLDVADWVAYEAARAALVPNLSNAVPAGRYRPAAVAA